MKALSFVQLLDRKKWSAVPTILCLCGSTRFKEAYQQANLQETLHGRIVLSIGIDTKSDTELAQAGIHLDKTRLDILHLHKIDLANEILVLNVGGYIDASTGNEIMYAIQQGKQLRFLEPDKIPQWVLDYQKLYDDLRASGDWPLQRGY